MTTLTQRLLQLPAPPRDQAAVELLVLRDDGGRRRTPEQIFLDREEGALGDRWSSGKRDVRAQVTLMRADVARLLVDDPAILGDNLFVSIDTSRENLPPGAVVRVGGAWLTVTEKPHTGCSKFARRAGEEALALTRAEAWAPQQLRGVHLRVVEPGPVRMGDLLIVESR